MSKLIGDNMIERWDVRRKLLTDQCPGGFCFLWSEENKNCRETFGICRRYSKNSTDRDWYEPCEPELKNHGLPWFYFVDEDTLSGEFKEEYRRQKKELWGER